jgi:UDP-N-acetylglucosamine 2-epimerase (non-hydrolysing)
MKRIIKWFLYMVLQTFFRFKKILPTQGLVLTHGDTVTAGLAAMMGRFARCDVAHVESGLRSYNILRPFPEELSRLITFTFSNIYFCPNEWAVNNLSFWQGEKINVKGNTMIDGVKFAIESESKHFSFQDQKYAIVSIHRYENIFKPIFTNFIIPKLKQISKNITLVFTLHPTTRERLKKIGMYTSLKKHPNIILHKRFNFINWINVCKHAEFVITDGGSNQEELSYLGTPSILFRKETERKEGLDENIILSKFDNTKINNFIKNYKKYRRPPIYNTETPSQKILNYIKSYTSQ